MDDRDEANDTADTNSGSISGTLSGRKRVSTTARLVIGAAAFSVLWFLIWTASGSNDRFWTKAVEETDYYAMLARGFRSGHLSLAADVPAELTKLADPYDPDQRRGLGMHDASFYKGKYYLYFGPAPVLTLTLPFELITGVDLQLAWETMLFSAVGYLILTLIVLKVWRRHFPTASLFAVVMCLLVLGLCTMVPNILRRSHIWEMPIAAAFCYCSAAVATTYLALHRRNRTLWFTLTGLFVGLAIASRAVYVTATMLPAGALIWLWWRGHLERKWNWWPGRPWWSPALACAGVLGTIVGLLLFYNYLRFDSPFEFGMKYQFTSVFEAKIQHFSPSYWRHNLRIYFANPAKWSLDYPYVLPGDPPAPGPKGYLYAEWVTAVFPNLPVYAMALVAPFALRGRDRAPLRGWVLGVLGIAATMSALLMGFVSSADRYMVDFLPSWALVACVGILCVEAATAGHAAIRWVARLVWVPAAIISIFVGIIASIEVHGTFSDAAPAQYRRVMQLFTSPVGWLQGKNHDPALLILPRGGMVRPWSVQLEMPCDTEHWRDRCFPLAVAGRHEMADTVVLLVTAQGRLQLGFDHWGDGRVLSPEFDRGNGATIKLTLAYGALEEKHDDAPHRQLTVYLDGQRVWQTRVHVNSGLLDRVRIGENDIGATTCEKAYPAHINAKLSIPSL